MPSEAALKQPNMGHVGIDKLPAEIKLMILERVKHPRTLSHLARAYPGWVRGLWERYPETLFPRALKNTFRCIDAMLRPGVLCVYHIRRIRREFTIARRSSVETQTHRDRLQADLRSIVRSYVVVGNEDMPDLEKKLQTILDIWEIIRDINYLTHQYSNDAWRRIHNIAEKPDQQHSNSHKPTTPPEIKLSRVERFRFNRGFIRAEIYLLTRFWTSRQGQRYMLDMGSDINPCISHTSNEDRRFEFDSCLRFMFHSLRGSLKKVARDLGAPELPTRDDLQWVPAESEERDYLYKDDGSITPQGRPALDFARRSVSEEQRFLLWLCEQGIDCVRRTHRHDDGCRRYQFLANFSRRHIWDTVELRHRASRYDVDADVDMPLKLRLDPHRNRHPIMNLYGEGAWQGYTETSSPWACAGHFLEWTLRSTGYRRVAAMQRDGLSLPQGGHWDMWCDTDAVWSYRMPHKRKDGGTLCLVPRGHQYMLDPERYELNWPSR